VSARAEPADGSTVKGLDLQTLLKAGIGTKGTSFKTYKPAVAPSWRPIGIAAANRPSINPAHGEVHRAEPDDFWRD
jgi:hypothetical protein